MGRAVSNKYLIRMIVPATMSRHTSRGMLKLKLQYIVGRGYDTTESLRLEEFVLEHAMTIIHEVISIRKIADEDDRGSLPASWKTEAEVQDSIPG